MSQTTLVPTRTEVVPSRRWANMIGPSRSAAKPFASTRKAQLSEATAASHTRIKGDFDSAIAEYTEAIRLRPNLAWAYYNRGLAYEGKGELDRAKLDFDQAERLGFTPK